MLSRFIKHKKFFGIIMTILILIPLLPDKAEAHDAYYLQVLIDSNTYSYQGNVIKDDLSFTKADKESTHIEAQFGNFLDLIDDPYPVVSMDKKWKETKVTKETELPFTFPPKEDGDSIFDKKPKSNASREDIERAYTIMETLVPGLNEALKVLNNNEDFKSVKGLINMSGKLTNAIRNGGGTVNGYKITLGKRASYAKVSKNEYKKLGVSEKDYLLITKSNGGKKVEYEFIYQMPKGYNKKGDWNNTVYRDIYDFKGDASKITWNMLVYQAVYGYAAKGYTASHIGEIAKPGALEEAVVSLFQNLLDGIRSLLGLYDINELVYNDGIRGSQAYDYGIFPDGWLDHIKTFHWIFQGIAWSLIILAIVKMLIQRNLATVNPAVRVSMIEQIQNLLIAGFLLINIFPIVDMLLYLNMKLVDVFGAIAPDLDELSNINNYSNTISGIVLQFFYFFISIYLNFVYIIRAISLGLLISSGPLFVVSLAFGGRYSQLFGKWIRELISNIFLQAFHAFLLAFFILTSTQIRGIEGIVVLYALLPLTEFFRTMVLGEGAGVAHKLGMGSLATGLTAVRSATGQFPIGTSKIKEKPKTIGEQRQEGRGSGNGYGKSSAIDSDIRMRGSGSAMEERKVELSQAIPAGVDKMNKEQAELYEMLKKPKEKISPFKAGVKDAKSIFTSSVNPKNGYKLTKGFFKGSLGAGMAMAFGGQNEFMSRESARIVGEGLQDMGNAGEEMKDAIVDAGHVLKEGAKENIKELGLGTDAGEDISTGELLNQPAYINRLANGDVEKHHDIASLAEQGLVFAQDDPKGNTVIEYDPSRLGENDRKNLEEYYKIFNSGNQNAINHLKSAGVNNIGMNAKGNYVVSYNQAGKQKLGFESMEMVGGNRVIERKTQFQPLDTRKTFSVPQRTVEGMNRNPIVDEHGNPLKTS